MPQTATALSLNPRTAPFSPSPRGLEKLSVVLKKYQSDSDLESLRSALSLYISRQEQLRESEMNHIQAIIRAFKSFNIAPSNSYERYMAVLKNRSDLEAIRSDWEMVGEDLSFALIDHILKEREKDDE